MTEKALPQPSLPEARRRTFTPYVTTWSVLAALSLVYLGLLAAQPAVVAEYLGPGPHAAQVGEGASEETVAELRALRTTVDMFRNELIEMRAQVSNQTDVTSDLMGRLANLETASAGDRVAEATVINGQDEARAPPPPGNVQTAAVPAPVRKNADAGGKTNRAKKNVETGSVAAPAAGAGSNITFGPPVVKQAATPPPANPPPGTRNMIGVQIATGPSVDSLRLSWTLLSERHADSFRALEPRYAPAGEGANQSYSLIVGPMPTVDEARRLCEDLALKATPCRVSQFTGDALM